MKVGHILIVDDDSEDSEFFTMVVNQIDPAIQIEVATSKDELFEQLEKKTPDLLFIDSFLQHHSGVASICEIKNEKNWKELPVIMYTGAEDSKTISNAFKAGASAYIVKPHSVSDIREILHLVLNKDWNEPGLPKHFYKDNQLTIYKGE